MHNGALLHGNERVFENMVLVGVNQREHELAFQNFGHQLALFQVRYPGYEHVHALGGAFRGA